MDNFFIKMFRREVTPTLTEQQAQAATQVTGATYEENIVQVTSQDVALRIATFYRCVSLRANTMAQLTCQYQRLNKEGGNFIKDNYGRNGELNYLLQMEPNPMMSAFELWRQVEIEIIMRGNAFILIERDGEGWPKAFWLAGCAGYNDVTDTYTLTWNQPGGVKNGTFRSKDVIHIANTFRHYGGLMGISTLAHARDTLSLSSTLDKGALDTSAKGGRMKLLIGEEKPTGGAGTLAYGMFNKGQMDKYAQEIQSKLYGNDVVALRGLDKIQNISMSAADMQLFEQRQFGVAEICRTMDVPRSLVMDGSNSSYKTPEADRLDFLMNCIQPKRRLIEDELNRKLLTRFDFDKRRIHLCELPLMMFDKKGQAEIDKVNLETGAMTVNEIRKQYDMPAVENGDIVYISTNLAELGSDKLRGNSGGNPEPTGLTGNEGAAPAAPQNGEGAQPAQNGEQTEENNQQQKGGEE